MEVRFFAATDLGRKRSANEDNFLVDQNLRLFVVADGMGGHASGEVASALAVHAVRDVVARERDLLEDYDDEDPRSHVEVCTLLTDYDAVRMYDVDVVEQVLGVTIGDHKPDEYVPAKAYEEYFSEGGLYRHLGKGSRIRDKMNAEERALMARER